MNLTTSFVNFQLRYLNVIIKSQIGSLPTGAFRLVLILLPTSDRNEMTSSGKQAVVGRRIKTSLKAPAGEAIKSVAGKEDPICVTLGNVEHDCSENKSTLTVTQHLFK